MPIKKFPEILISQVTGLPAALAAKLNSVIDFTALANNTTSISKSSFADKAGVQITYDDGLNKTITLNDDLKDGSERRIRLINAHASTSVLYTFPTPVRTGSNGQINVPATNFSVDAKIFWDGSDWDLTWNEVRSVKST